MTQALIIYDSFFGNTEQIARAIARGLGTSEEVVVKVNALPPNPWQGVQLLVVGSPTRAFRPSPAITAFLKSIPEGALQGVQVAAFDTRIAAEDAPGILKLMVRLFGWAAKPIADSLVRKGGTLIQSPEGFYVAGSEGPLKEGELERATAWGAALARAMHRS